MRLPWSGKAPPSKQSAPLHQLSPGLWRQAFRSGLVTGQMVMQHPGDLRSDRGLSDVINGAQLHRLQVALHFELPRHHDDGQPAIDLACALNHATPLEETAPLTYNDERESTGFQLADAFGV